MSSASPRLRPTSPEWVERLSTPLRASRTPWMSTISSPSKRPVTAPEGSLLHQSPTRLSAWGGVACEPGFPRAPHYIGSYFPSLGLEDPNTPLGFSSPAHRRPGTLVGGGLARSRFLDALPQRYLEHRSRMVAVRSSPRKSNGLLASPASRLKRAAEEDGPSVPSGNRSTAGGALAAAAKDTGAVGSLGGKLRFDDFGRFLRLKLDGTPELDECG